MTARVGRSSGRWAVAVSVLAVLGTTVSARAVPTAATSACHPEWPMVFHHAGGQAMATPAGATGPVPCISETGFATSESTIAVTDAGAIFFSPADTENSMTRSLDGGATWDLVAPRDLQRTALWNTVDPQVVVDHATGRVFWVHATGDLRTAPVVVEGSPSWQLSTGIAYAHGFQVYSSADNGASWTTADYQHEFTGDWEQLFVGPPPAAATGAAQPSRYPNIVYLCANAPFEISGPTRGCYKSLDGGRTFKLTGFVLPSPAYPDVCPALADNAGVVARDGTIYLPMTCWRGAYLAVSNDEGSTFTWLPVPNAPPTASTGPGFQLAIDAADNLSALWMANDQLMLTTSADGGRSWGHALSIGSPGVRNIALPALAMGPAGHVGVVYYGTTSPSAAKLTAYATETADVFASPPLFVSRALNDPVVPIFRNFGFNATPRADYIGATYDSAGTLWAGVVKQLAAPDAGSRVATTGYVAHLATVSP